MESEQATTIDWWWSGDYWDGPIDGWLRARGRYLYFSCIDFADDGDRPRLYAVFDVPKALRVPHLLMHRRFRHMVGWHNDSCRPYRPFSMAARPHWLAFYSLPKPPALDLGCCRRVGTVTDFRLIQMEHAYV